MRGCATSLSESDPAPYAALVGALGPPVGVGSGPTAHRPEPTAVLGRSLFLALLALLLTEWGSRRARGAR